MLPSSLSPRLQSDEYTNFAMRCELHKLETDINFIERICKQCGLLNVLNSQGYCCFCQPGQFEKFKIRTEHIVMKFLEANGIIFVNNEIPNGSNCGKEHPDFVIRFDTHIAIIEVDEGQHKPYECSCEQIPMVNVTQTFGGLPCFWLRYNPDEFKPEKKFEHCTCFRYKALGKTFGVDFLGS